MCRGMISITIQHHHRWCKLSVPHCQYIIRVQTEPLVIPYIQLLVFIEHIKLEYLSLFSKSFDWVTWLPCLLSDMNSPFFIILNLNLISSYATNLLVDCHFELLNKDLHQLAGVIADDVLDHMSLCHLTTFLFLGNTWYGPTRGH